MLNLLFKLKLVELGLIVLFLFVSKLLILFGIVFFLLFVWFLSNG